MKIELFNSDAFNLESLTAAINEQPPLPSEIAKSGLFEEEGIMTTSVIVEKNVDTLTLIPNQNRSNHTPVKTGGSSRSLIPFLTTHLPTQDNVTADDIQNLRAFGSASELETLQQLVAKRLSKMKKRIDATIEFQRIGAIKGEILDADGTSIISNMFQAFSITQQTHNFAFSKEATDIRAQALNAIDKLEEALGNEPYSGLRCLCGKTFFRALIAHPGVKKAYEAWQDGVFLRSDPRRGFEFTGITFSEYRGSVGGVPFVEDESAYLYPEGVTDMFMTRFAPANYVETANTLGLPYYAKQEMINLGKGINIEVQSNPISICTRPRAVIKLMAV